MKSQRLLSNAEIASFCSQTAMILNAGITPYEGMSILMQDTKDEKGKALVNTIIESLGQGETFYKALGETDVFPEAHAFGKGTYASDQHPGTAASGNRILVNDNQTRISALERFGKIGQILRISPEGKHQGKDCRNNDDESSFHVLHGFFY